MVARRVRARGQVQGVFFRDSCREQARRHGVAGWVRNCDDGSVEALFEGEPAAVDALVEWCRTGPPQAEVRGVEVEDLEPAGLRDFRVTQD